MKFLLLFLIILLSGCFRKDTKQEYPIQSNVDQLSTKHGVNVNTITMDDGAKCVIITRYSDAVAVSCDWSNAK